MGRRRVHASDAEWARSWREQRAHEQVQESYSAAFQRAEEAERRLRRLEARKADYDAVLEWGGGRQPVAEKLVKVLGMLASEVPTERDKAARAATEIMREAGLTWEQLLNVGQRKRRAKTGG
jgi:hypothetical protein